MRVRARNSPNPVRFSSAKRRHAARNVKSRRLLLRAVGTGTPVSIERPAAVVASRSPSYSCPSFSCRSLLQTWRPLSLSSPVSGGRELHQNGIGSRRQLAGQPARWYQIAGQLSQNCTYRSDLGPKPHSDCRKAPALPIILNVANILIVPVMRVKPRVTAHTVVGAPAPLHSPDGQSPSSNGTTAGVGKPRRSRQ